MAQYYDIDDILAHEELVPAVFLEAVNGAGLFESNESNTVEPKSKVELPFWLAQELHLRHTASVGVPPCFNKNRWVLKSVSPEQFMTVANAIDAAKQWDSDLVEAKYIKDLDENLSIIRLKFGESSKPLFHNREFIVYERRETMDDGTLVVAVASLPKEIAAGLQPKQTNSIRGLLLQSGWVVEKLDDDSCMVTYVVQLDPAGWLPKFFVNRFNTKLVMIIENLWKQAQACSDIPEIHHEPT